MKTLILKPNKLLPTKLTLFTVLIAFGCIFLPSVTWGLEIIPGLKGFGTDTRAAYGAVNDPIIFIVTDLSTDNGTPGKRALQQCNNNK